MNSDQLISKLANGERIYGTAVVSASPHWPRTLQEVGLDFAFIDTEHMALDRQQMMTMCQWYSGINVVPIVRILAPDPNLASLALDAGAMGILVPYVEHVHEVKSMVGAVKYRPLKGEKLDALLSGTEKLDPVLDDYLQAHNGHRLLWINIESLAAVDQLPALLDVEGLDGIVIGPHDLSCSMDIPEQYDHPDFIKVVEGVFHQCQEKNLPAGIHFSEDAQRQSVWVKKGATIVLHSSDMALFRRSLVSDLNAIRAEAGDEIMREGGGSTTI